MPMNTAKLITLGLLRSSGAVADDPASFTVTTTGAATLTIQILTVSASTTVDWGDGSSSTYTAGTGVRTHNYAGAGTWAMQILEPLNVTALDMRDSKLTYAAGTVRKMPNLTVLTAVNGMNVAIEAGEIGSLKGLTVLNFTTNQTNVFVGAGEIAGLTNLTTLILAQMANVTLSATETTTLTKLTELVLVQPINAAVQTGLATLVNLVTFRYENLLTTAQVNSVLQQLWTMFPARVAAGGTVDLLGGVNQGPTGPVAAENPPTYGGAYAYELVNDSGSVNPTKKWVSVTTATPV